MQGEGESSVAVFTFEFTQWNGLRVWNVGTRGVVGQGVHAGEVKWEAF